jgi:hypothetical protein
MKVDLSPIGGRNDIKDHVDEIVYDITNNIIKAISKATNYAEVHC